MTPPAASATHRRELRRGSAPRSPRRVSGPARAARAGSPAGTLAGSGLGRIDLRLPRPDLRGIAGRVQVGGLLGGRLWIGIFAGLLLGLVFLQVSLLKLNSGISENVARAQVLERQNAGARGTISRLDAGQRIQDVAGQLGMVMPGAGAVCYLRVGIHAPCSGGDAAAAAAVSDPLVNTAPPVPVGATDASEAGPETTQADPAAAQTDPAAAQTDPATTQTDPAAGQTEQAGGQTDTGAAAPQDQAQAPTADQTAPSGTDTGGISAATAGG